MAQMKVDYAQHIVKDDANEIRCILTTDAKHSNPLVENANMTFSAPMTN